MGGINERSGHPVRGWLLVLCVLLLAWEPIRFGLVASNALRALSYRGAPLAAILAARVFVTALGVAAGLALVAQRASGVAMAKVALLIGVALDIVVYTTPAMPTNRMPGDTPFYIAASLGYHGAWFAYLLRSKRVRNTYA
jgi:hypothetical protein